MSNIVIFSGTTEGRTLSERLSKAKIRHTVCVATEYGKEMMDENEYAKVHVGRMDAEEMELFLSEVFDGGRKDSEEKSLKYLIIDATHPYAVEVTKNIRKAAKSLGVKYLRVSRSIEARLPKDAVVYHDIEKCAASMDSTEGNILLTTGSKELHIYCENVSEDTKNRTYVRVLPSVQSLKLCEDENIAPDHIVAMQGPFSKELNEAVIRQYDIKHLITKESGASGGFAKKVEAAETSGIKLHMIERPDDKGISLDGACKLILSEEPFCSDNNDEGRFAMRISLVGLGMGRAEFMTKEAIDIIANSDVVFGAKRLIKDIEAPVKYEMYRAEDIIPVLERKKPEKAAIIFSGDTGFYSGAKKMFKALKNWKDDADVKVIPGISSISYFAAKLGESYDDACLFSIHGRKNAEELETLLEKIKYSKKVFILLSDSKDVQRLSKRLEESGLEGKIVVGADFSYESEKICEMTFKEGEEYCADGVLTALVVNYNPLKRPLINVARDTDFIRGEIPMTKEVIRHESIIRLNLKERDVFYDIGGGTGSVAIEAAQLSPSLKVYTIERKPQAAELIRKNVLNKRLSNVTVIEGAAEEVLAGMEKPDCVFIGGSGGKLKYIIELLKAKGSGIRYVINAVSLETMCEVREIINEYEPADEETIMISISDVKKLASYHMLQGQNPIWIFSFTI
ncbi:bifunctional cobalt-precorrin-7 (C(5))-methyltransferase/cobalt-precorrin-6B (C(15))-methyltransferase [Butyrivibrio sp. WCE2006]|uniref:bifunctional cobalt-precorrin-7 (C(5))-methyltransferase/cobalt-precorrin-6B (C(15))-methyltransferase n=1 Tax=Butyrivibrio sp. WCE2006 TaxID=1410611 RepID=UPI0005D169FC|nr:bifunctional cobalt-precorrin-7 (C(5))-methyltransferase/cobalt-precorrin-6B (C(15))-methyltransferase [Butyrivibrio sp. WCE2006]